METEGSVTSGESHSIGIVRDRTAELRDWNEEPDGPLRDRELDTDGIPLPSTMEEVANFASMVGTTIVSTVMEFDKSSIEVFRDSVTEVKESIDSLKLQIREVKGLQAQFINSPNLQFGGQTKESELIEMRCDDIKQVSNAIKASIRLLQREIEDAKRRGEDMNGIEMRERRTLCRSMTKLMLEVTSDYYESQLQFKEKVKSKIQRQLELADQGFTAEEIERMYEANMNVYSQAAENLYLSMTLDEAVVAKGKAEERHEAMDKLMKALDELFQLFQDLALWVEDQTELLDSVELHIENSVDLVRKATKDTRQAVLYARAARRKQVMIAILVLILLGGGAGFAFYYMQSKGIISF